MNSTAKIFKNIGLKRTFVGELFADNFECLNCGAEIVKNDNFCLCQKCFDEIKFITHSCIVCGDTVGSFDAVCENCKKTSHNFSRTFCVAKYEGVARSLVLKLKYGKSKYLAKSLAHMMSRTLLSCCLQKFDFVIPVPLNKTREKHRGFNQSALLSGVVAQDILSQSRTDIISRVRNTPTQTHLNTVERRENVKNAFKIASAKDVKGASVLVVDDIITTGATMDEIAKILLKHGAKQVFGLAFCHA